MAIKVLQQSTLRRLVVTIFYFCCFQCDNTPVNWCDNLRFFAFIINVNA